LDGFQVRELPGIPESGTSVRKALTRRRATPEHSRQDWRLVPASCSNAGDKPWQMVVLDGTQRIQSTISEWGAAIC
jgi:hypothetical protein